jgi:hypothetical protein
MRLTTYPEPAGAPVSLPCVPVAAFCSRKENGLSPVPHQPGFFAERLPGMARHNGTAGLQFSVLVQRHQALFSLGALRFLLAYLNLAGTGLFRPSVA